jgi:hypothetical protein
MAKMRIGLVCAVCSIATVRAAGAQLDVREQSLGMRPDSVVTSASSYSMRIAYVVRTPTGKAVVLDGVRGPSFTDIPHRVTEAGARPNLSFSFDGNRLAYQAQQGTQMVAVVDGIVGPAYDVVQWGFSGARDAFTRDSRHSGYLATRDGKTLVVIDGAAGRPYDKAGAITYSPRNQRFSYVAYRDGRTYLVANNEEVEEGPHVTTAVYSDSGERVAFTITKPAGRAVVVDGVEGKTFRDIRIPIRFSRDGTRYMYAGIDSLSRTVVVIDGVPGRGYQRIQGFGFDGDGRPSYTVVENGRKFLVLDGKEQPKVNEIDSLVSIQRDGALAYVVKRGDQELMVRGTHEGPRYDRIYPVYYRKDGGVTYIATREDRQFVVVDSTELAFDQIAGVYPVNNPVVISGRRGAGWYVIVNGKTAGPYSDAVHFVVDSRDGRRLAYIASREGKRFAVVDGVEGRAYDEVRWLNFSLDGRHVFFLARRLDKWFAVADGEESPAYDEILSMSPIDFMSHESFKMLARRAGEDLRVTVSWPKR